MSDFLDLACETTKNIEDFSCGICGYSEDRTKATGRCVCDAPFNRFQQCKNDGSKVLNGCVQRNR